MSKRFTETDIWDEDWFIDMPKEYKLFYFYVKDQCNHAGIWRPNLRLFEAIIEVKIDLKKAIDFFNRDKDRIQILPSGHWYILDFFVFQYGPVLNLSNRVHKSIENIYNKEDIKLTSIRGLKDLKEGVKDKDKDKEEIVSNDYKILKEQFEIFRQNYPGTKRGLNIEFENLKKKYKDWKEIIPVLSDALNYQKSAREIKHRAGGFVPEWKNLQTWINQRCWEEEIEINNISNEAVVRNNSKGADIIELTELVHSKIGVQQ